MEDSKRNQTKQKIMMESPERKRNLGRPSGRRKDSNEIDFKSTVEFHLSGLIGTVSNPVMQKIRIIGFSFEKRLH